MDKKFVAITITLSVLIMVGFTFFTRGSETQTKNQTYQASDKEKPQVLTKTVVADLGDMKVSDEKSYDFIISNSGKKPLQLSKVSTSCGCTIAQIIIDGKISPEFGMHSNSNYIAEVQPGKKTTITTIYKPYIICYS